MIRPMPPLYLSAALALAGAARAANLDAVLDWPSRSPLGLAESGVIQQVQVQPGQSVRQGDLLLALDPTPFRARLAQAQAEADLAGAEEADAKRDLDRANELYARTVTSTTELDAVRIRHARARAQLAAAQARLELARHRLARSELRAPLDGVVMERRAEPGMAISAECQPPVLVILAPGDQLVARAKISQELAVRMTPGANAQVQVQGQVLDGTVSAVRLLGEQGSRLEVTIPRHPSLAPGQPATIRTQP